MFSTVRLSGRLSFFVGVMVHCCAAAARLCADDLSQVIDRHLEVAFPLHHVDRAADPADDFEFVRRVRLDLTGIIPTVAEVRDFAADRSPDKHERLIERLSASDEFAEHMAAVFDVMLMERRPDEHVPSDEWRTYLAESFRANKPLDVLVREILASDGVDPAMRPAAKFVLDREAAHDLLVRDIGRLFLGVDLQCAQCHDHPTVDDYQHQHYYGLHVFVAGTKLYRVPGGGMMQLQEGAVREATFASVFAPDVQRKTGPRIMDGPALDVPVFEKGEEYLEKTSSKSRSVPKFSLRSALSQTLPRSETREFSRNMANRLWAQLMGRGVVHPLDMHHKANPPSHPDLLDSLTAGLVGMKFDARQFIRELARSRAYRRSSLAPIGVDANAIPEASYAMANMKPLSPEQLFASFVRATGNELTLERELDDALAIAETANLKAADDSEALKQKTSAQDDAAARRKARVSERANRVKAFADLFGSTPGSPEGEFQASLTQALFLANAPSVADWLKPQHNNLAERLIALTSSQAVADEVYLSILSRPAAADETKVIADFLDRTKDRPTAISQLIWSLAASAEFRLNH